MVGFERKNQNVLLTSKKTTIINFQLETHVYKLDEISVTTKRDYDWIGDAELFRKNFLGSSVNSKECKIINRETLDFSNH